MPTATHQRHGTSLATKVIFFEELPQSAMHREVTLGSGSSAVRRAESGIQVGEDATQDRPASNFGFSIRF
jgi:hypothetical protein